MNKQTKCVHAGQRTKENLGVVNPIDPSTAFQYVDEGDQYYPRYFNTPNQAIVVDKLRELEGAESGVIFSSGMAAISTTMMSLLKPGDHAVLLAGLYGGTHSYVTHEFDEIGIAYDFASADAQELVAAANDNTKLIFVESPANPLLDVIDLRKLATEARTRNITTVIDNTFASPINQNPIELGIDIVVHSGTKYLGGHSDLCFGAVLGSQEHITPILSKAIHFGGSLNALTCYLIERSLKTLAVRVEKQNSNAQQIAEFLYEQPWTKTVYYPGLDSHSAHEIAAGQMSGFGGMVSFEPVGQDPVQRSLAKLDLITPAMSLGGVESTVVLPVFASHRLMPAADREALGITDRLLRMSVGIEDAGDLIRDLEQAFSVSTAAAQVTKALI